MKQCSIILFVSTFTLFSSGFAHVYSRCDLAQALLDNGIPPGDLENWVCLVEAESSRNTSAIGGPNTDSSYDYGLFQINDRYWCAHGRKGGECNVKCESLIDDDITDDSQCALLIYREMGFPAWHGWTNKCEGKPLPDLSPCNLPNLRKILRFFAFIFRRAGIDLNSLSST